jgi:RNA polymerase sigma-70 factor (ECF subfamily)
MAFERPERWIELASRIERHDPAAEEELARLFYPHLMALAASRLSDRETACEIAQEAFLAVLSALREGRLREPEKLPSFVVGTGRNLIKSCLRRKARHPDPLSLGSNDASVPSACPDAGDPSLERDEEKSLVLSALQRLKPVDREILLLTLVEGLNPREIALEMGLKSETVRLRKSRALRRLQRRLRILTRIGRRNDL